MHPVIETLRKTLPPVFPRCETGKLTGNVVAGGTMANHDSRGDGPVGVFFVGRKACYTKEAFLSWLEGRLASKSKRNPAKEIRDKREAV